MANSRPKQENLVRQKPNWKHLPTKVVRIPEVFESQVIELARKLDNHTVSKEGLKKSGLEYCLEKIGQACIKDLGCVTEDTDEEACPIFLASAPGPSHQDPGHPPVNSTHGWRDFFLRGR